jgi:hypothetical protein
MKRCQHEPKDLFDKPRKGDQHAAVIDFLHSHYTSRGWVICARCGLTGYWGGYGFKRRVRWGYGDDGILKSAEHHNRVMNGIQFDRDSI